MWSLVTWPNPILLGTYSSMKPYLTDDSLLLRLHRERNGEQGGG